MPSRFYSIKTSVAETAMKIEQALRALGAQHVEEIRANNVIEGFAFARREAWMRDFQHVDIQAGDIQYTLPLNWRTVYRRLNLDMQVATHLKTAEQAQRVCARQLQNWLEIQADFIRSGAMSFEEAFMGLMVPSSQLSVYTTFLVNRVRDVGLDPSCLEIGSEASRNG